MYIENRPHLFELILDEDRYNELHTKVLHILRHINQVLNAAVLMFYFNKNTTVEKAIKNDDIS